MPQNPTNQPNEEFVKKIQAERNLNYVPKRED